MDCSSSFILSSTSLSYTRLRLDALVISLAICFTDTSFQSFDFGVTLNSFFTGFIVAFILQVKGLDDIEKSSTANDPQSILFFLLFSSVQAIIAAILSFSFGVQPFAHLLSTLSIVMLILSALFSASST